MPVGVFYQARCNPESGSYLTPSHHRTFVRESHGCRLLQRQIDSRPRVHPVPRIRALCHHQVGPVTVEERAKTAMAGGRHNVAWLGRPAIKNSEPTALPGLPQDLLGTHC